MGYWGNAPNDPLPGVEQLAKATGQPALGTLILDSDCGPIAAATPSGATWTGTLAKSTAINSYEMPDDGITGTAAVTTFHHWATDAGLPTNATLITQRLRSSRHQPRAPLHPPTPSHRHHPHPSNDLPAASGR